MGGDRSSCLADPDPYGEVNGAVSMKVGELQ
jgi:hypothetical protein